MSATRTGAIPPTVGALLIGLASALAAPSLAAGPSPLAGTVRDSLGHVVAGAEILFVRVPSATWTPEAVTRSDEAGRFEVAKLVPGRYRFAALKQGYRTLVGQVDTVVQDSLELVLRPAVTLDEASLPRDSAWALRVPRRGMLYEVGADPSALDDDAPPGGGLDDAPRLELEQFFSLRADSIEHRPDDTEIRPSETRVTLASAIGERGNISVEGRREQLDATSPQDLLETTASQQGSSVNLDLSYETSPDAQLAVNAYFNQTDYELAAEAPQSPAPLQQQQQTWGYDAAWSKQIDAARRFVVALGFRDTSLVRPAHANDPVPAGSPMAQNGVSNRAVGARGSYRNALNERHDLHIALRTQLLRWPSTTLTTIPVAPGAGDRSTWTVQADAQDTWSVSSPFSLIYGFGYKQALTAGDATLVVPRLGGSLAAGGWFLRALVSYHSVAGADAPTAADGLAPFQPENSLGYEAEVELPVARDVRLRGGVSYSPIQFDLLGYLRGGDGPGEHPLYLTDGNSAVQEHRLSVVEERGRSRTYLELADGRAEGTVAPLLPFEGPLPAIAGRQLRYRNGRLGVMFPSHRTDVRVEYRRVEAAGTGERRDSTESVQESVELRVKTDVPAMQIPGDWRVLLAVRLGSVRSGELESWSPYDGAESVDALNRRISAGVAVLF